MPSINYLKLLPEGNCFITFKCLDSSGFGVLQNKPRHIDILFHNLSPFFFCLLLVDEPPPPPKAPPPQLKIRKKETVEVEEKFETVIQSDQQESFEPRIEPDVEQKPLIDYASFERAITELYPQNKKYFLMYSKVPWSLLIRKEVGIKSRKCMYL